MERFFGQLGLLAFSGALLAAGVMLATIPSYAQQPAAHVASPEEQALGKRLFTEIQEGLQCSTKNINLEGELAKATAKVKELEGKLAATAAAPAPPAVK